MFTAINQKITIFSGVRPCILVVRYIYILRIQFLRFQFKRSIFKPSSSNLNYNERFNQYRAVNTPSLSNKKQSVNAV